MAEYIRRTWFINAYVYYTEDFPINGISCDRSLLECQNKKKTKKKQIIILITIRVLIQIEINSWSDALVGLRVVIPGIVEEYKDKI